MNYDFCRYKCGHMFRPVGIVREENRWYLKMGGDCRYVLIEDSSPFLNSHEIKGGMYLFDDDVTKILWDITVSPESSCPYCAEHMMHDINHHMKLENFKFRRSYAKTDGKELP